MNSKPRKVRYETIVVALALLTGLAVRIGWLDRVAIDHFDEGVYSSNLWFADATDGQYPMRHLYAPPLLPTAIEWCQVFLGPTTLASILPSLVAGWLSIFLVWRLLHRWYGSDAAIFGVWLAALSDFHAVYSRMALTDVLLGFFLLLAVGLCVEAILRGGLIRILLAGLATGLAWWTKYNGWLPLAIAGSGSAAWVIFHRPRSVPVAKVGMRWLLIACVAAAVWSPVWFGLQDKGGYSAVAANHRGYLNPPSEWTSALVQQMVNHRVLEGWFTLFSIPFSILAGGVLLAQMDSRFTWKLIPAEARQSAIFKFTCGCLVLGISASVIGMTASLLIVAVGGLAGSLVWQRSNDEPLPGADKDQTRGRRTLASWMIAAWLIGLLLATPAYRPYPRLTLPLLIATWLGVSIALAWWIRATKNAACRSTKRGVSAVWFAVVMLVSVPLIADLNLSNPSLTRAVPTSRARTGLANLVQQIGRKMGDQKFTTFTYGEPALLHLLNAAGHPTVPTASLNSIPGHQPGQQLLVVVGDQARRSAEFPSQWTNNAHRLESLLVRRFQPSDAVALNDPVAAAQLVKFLWRRRGWPSDTESRLPPETKIEVFRVVNDR